MKICKQCGSSKLTEGPDICIICDGMEFEEKEVDQSGAKCKYCGKVSQQKENLPFYNAASHTYYCGCMGWN